MASIIYVKMLKYIRTNILQIVYMYATLSLSLSFFAKYTTIWCIVWCIFTFQNFPPPTIMLAAGVTKNQINKTKENFPEKLVSEGNSILQSVQCSPKNIVLP